MRSALVYQTRREAGRALAEAFAAEHEVDDSLLVLGLPRGGVVVAYELAVALRAPLDVLVVRKLGVPGHEELAMGAIASGGVMKLNRHVIARLGISEQTVRRVAEAERLELQRREQVYRGDHPQPVFTDRTCVLVDDGLATGASMLAAVQSLREHDPGSVIVAVPVAPPDTADQFRRMPEIDALICPAEPANFSGVGQWYEDFHQVSDDEVRDLLQRAWGRATS